ncbi:hypothetical protein ABLE68_00775 [Nocardioides sp. CN2-186]|uniref:hypothetical protein n=1 Tax=Nocardioides tweenelious TaxID=3156607 RepID=UPI0032B54253
MVTSDDVRRVGLALPRTYESFTGGRSKLKVRQIVYVGFSRDELQMGFGYPKDARDGLVEADPETFFLPRPSDLRYQCETTRADRGTRSGRRSARLSKPRGRACEAGNGASKPSK